MINAQESYSNEVKKAVWKNTLSDKELEGSQSSGYTVRTDRQLAWVVAGTLGTLVCIPGVTNTAFGTSFDSYNLDSWCQTPSTALPRHAQANETVSIAEMIELAKETFGLSAVQIAGILNISRPSLYNHISGKEMPKNTSPYEALFRTTKRVQSRVGCSLKPGLKNILIEGNTLLGHLKQSYADADLIERYSQLIAEKLGEIKPTSSIFSLSEQKKAIFTIGKSG